MWPRHTNGSPAFYRFVADIFGCFGMIFLIGIISALCQAVYFAALSPNEEPEQHAAP